MKNVAMERFREVWAQKLKPNGRSCVCFLSTRLKTLKQQKQQNHSAHDV
jgi:hypothetical protein